MKFYRLQVLLILLLVVLCFAQAFGFEFVNWDDESLIVGNEFVAEPTLERAYAAWLEPHENLYIPLTYNVWALLAAAGQTPAPDGAGITLNPYVFHGANILLHAGSALLVYGILRNLLKSGWAATAGALLWAMHPMQVESVAWATGMKDVLSGFLALASISLYISAASSPRSAAWKRRALFSASYVCMLLSPFAKPGAVAIPLAVFAIDWLLLGRPVRKAAIASFPLLLAVLPATIITQIAQPSAGGADVPPLWARPLIAGHALAFYIRKIIWPDYLTYDYGQRPATVMAGWWWYVAWLIPAAITVLVVIYRKARWPAASWITFLAGVAPVLGLAPFVFQFYSTVADRYVYLSIVGAGLAFAVLLTKLKPKVAFALASAILLALGIRTAFQVSTWSDSMTLHQHALKVNPGSFTAPNWISILYDREADAIREATQRMHPSDPRVARAIARADELDREAEALVRYSLKNFPDYFTGLNNLAIYQINRGEMEAALDSLQRAVDAVDRFPPQLTSGTAERLIVGRAAMALKRYDQAAENFRKFLVRYPGHREAEALLARAEALARTPATTTTSTTQPQ